jgi:DNA polymerase-1
VWPSGQTFRLWVDQLGPLPPYRTDVKVLFVCFVGNAELLCHLTKNWPLPVNVLDLNTEFRCITNGRTVPAGKGLLGALAYYRFNDTDCKHKAAMQQRIAKGFPFTAVERAEIIKYCASDVDALHRLLGRMLPELDLAFALYRGAFVRSLARMEHRGVPLDGDIYRPLSDNHVWRYVRNAMVPMIDADYGVYVRGADGDWHFSLENFEGYLEREGIAGWPRTETGKLSTRRKTFEDMCKGYPQLESLRQLRHVRDKLRKIKLTVGADNRNRSVLWPFKAKTGRTQPKASQWIFSPAVWLRFLIKPEPGRALAYVDISSEEFLAAASLSRDPMMLKFYRNGDPYLSFAKRVGAAPSSATKKTHEQLRDRYKTGLLLIQYCGQNETLAARLNIPTFEAHEMINQHRELFSVYWRWVEDWLAHALNTGVMWTPFGWQCRTGITEFNARSIMNWPVQSCSAEILRIICIWADRYDLQIVAPVHDAVLLESSIERIEVDVALLQEIMRRAGRIVLNPDNDPFICDLRTDAKIIGYPERFTDRRGAALWERVLELLDHQRHREAISIRSA